MAVINGTQLNDVWRCSRWIDRLIFDTMIISLTLSKIIRAFSSYSLP